MLIKLEHKERSYQQRKLPAGENRTNPGPPGCGFCGPCHAKQKFLKKFTKRYQMLFCVWCLAMRGPLLLWQPLVKAIRAQRFEFIEKELTHQEHENYKNIHAKTTKEFNSKTNIRNVTDEEVKQSKTVLQMNTKKCLYIRRWNIPTLVSNSGKMQQLVRALNYHRLHILDITETHMSHSSDYIFPDGLLLLYSGRDDGMLEKSLQKEKEKVSYHSFHILIELWQFVFIVRKWI